MNVLNPYAFYLLPLLGLILFFYLLKGRPREINVSSILFWRKIPQTLTSQNFRWRLPPELLLFLQIALLTLLIFALAQIVLPIRGEKKEYLVAVIDTTASMKAKDVSSSRFDVAKRKAKEFVKNLPQGKKVALIQMDNIPHLLANFSDDRATLLQKLEELEAKDVEGDVEKTLKLANSLFPLGVRKKIVFFTDGAFNVSSKLLSEEVEFVIFNSGRPSNIGITSLKVRPRIIGRRNYEVMVKVGNFSFEEKTFLLKLWLKERVLFENKMKLPPQREERYIYPVKIKEKGILKVEVIPYSRDDLLADNVAYCVFGPSKNLNVLLVSPGNLFLERALSSYSCINLQVKNKIFSNERLSDYDLVIFDGILPPSFSQGNIVCIGTLPLDYLPEEPNLIADPVLTEWKAGHPLLRFVNLTDTSIKYILQVPVLPGGKVIVKSGEYPILQTLQKDNFKLVFISFDLYCSNFPLQMSFPIFIFNLLQWFHPEVFDPDYYQVKTGKMFETVGIYRLDERTAFAANLTSSEESNLFLRLPSSLLNKSARKRSPIQDKMITDEFSFSFLFLLIFCLFLLVEWYLYHFPVRRQR